jgi:hypothetical protein
MHNLNHSFLCFSLSTPPLCMIAWHDATTPLLEQLRTDAPPLPLSLAFRYACYGRLVTKLDAINCSLIVCLFVCLK